MGRVILAACLWWHCGYFYLQTRDILQHAQRMLHWRRQLLQDVRVAAESFCDASLPPAALCQSQLRIRGEGGQWTNACEERGYGVQSVRRYWLIDTHCNLRMLPTWVWPVQWQLVMKR